MPTQEPKDPHFAATRQHEAYGTHKQATALMAAQRGWYFRSAWYKRLVPDTRRCFVHGEIMFDELPLSDEDLNIMYTDQNRGMASGPV